MRIARVIGSLLASVGVVAGGCAHQLPWPPTPDDVARINQEAHEEDGYLRIEYVDPIASDWDAHNLKAVAIESIDDDDISFRTREKKIELLPSERVRGVTVKDRDRGGLIGAGLGAAAGAGVVAGIWLVWSGLNDSPSYVDPKAVAIAVAIPAFVGLVVGYAVSGRKTYEFTRRR
jgi:hypothetical protein